jgi:hypothetical protein
MFALRASTAAQNAVTNASGVLSRQKTGSH